MHAAKIGIRGDIGGIAVLQSRAICGGSGGRRVVAPNSTVADSGIAPVNPGRVGEDGNGVCFDANKGFSGVSGWLRWRRAHHQSNGQSSSASSSPRDLTVKSQRSLAPLGNDDSPPLIAVNSVPISQPSPLPRSAPCSAVTMVQVPSTSDSMSVEALAVSAEARQPPDLASETNVSTLQSPSSTLSGGSFRRPRQREYASDDAETSAASPGELLPVLRPPSLLPSSGSLRQTALVSVASAAARLDATTLLVDSETHHRRGTRPLPTALETVAGGVKRPRRHRAPARISSPVVAGDSDLANTLKASDGNMDSCRGAMLEEEASFSPAMIGESPTASSSATSMVVNPACKRRRLMRASGMRPPTTTPTFDSMSSVASPSSPTQRSLSLSSSAPNFRAVASSGVLSNEALIRAARASDAAALREASAGRVFFSPKDDFTLEELQRLPNLHVLELLAHVDVGLAVVAGSGRSLASDKGPVADCHHLHGYVSWEVFDGCGKAEVTAEIVAIAVRRSLRRRGFGRLLLSFALERATLVSQATEVFLHVRPRNLPARFLYGSLGFRDQQNVPGYYQGSPGLRMRLRPVTASRPSPVLLDVTCCCVLVHGIRVASRDEISLELLSRAVREVVPVVKRRRWSLQEVVEMPPLPSRSCSNGRLLGAHDGMQRIEIMVRDSRRPSGVLPYDELLETLLHELVHFEEEKHEAGFYRLLREVVVECCSSTPINGIRATSSGGASGSPTRANNFICASAARGGVIAEVGAAGGFIGKTNAVGVQGVSAEERADAICRRIARAELWSRGRCAWGKYSPLLLPLPT
eukprot:TRINITY_DN35042_c0_g1_i1.p1 TRINITY_DN35042_c0_g1~~TRINITY_DN35042_c0_g1_i1.p1  ORF type:complete len:827 (+),score=133.32 TRINITY_DN35042_c0_g1_i1:52-2481(+)